MAAKPKQAKATAGHNSKDKFSALFNPDRRGLFFSHLNPIWEIEKAMNELSAEKTKLKRQAKAEGFEGYEIDEAIKIRKTDDLETVNNRLRRIMAINGFMNQPVAEQFSFFDAPNPPAIEMAHHEGLLAGLAAEGPRNNPYDPATKQYPAWEKGYDEGQAELRDGMQKKMEAANARKEAEAKKKAEGTEKQGEGGAAPSEEDLAAAQGGDADGEPAAAGDDETWNEAEPSPPAGEASSAKRAAKRPAAKKAAKKSAKKK